MSQTEPGYTRTNDCNVFGHEILNPLNFAEKGFQIDLHLFETCKRPGAGCENEPESSLRIHAVRKKSIPVKPALIVLPDNFCRTFVKSKVSRGSYICQDIQSGLGF